MLAPFLTFVVVALVVLGMVALRLNARVAELERLLEVETRHRDELQARVEILEERDADLTGESDESMLGADLHRLGKPGLKH